MAVRIEPHAEPIPGYTLLERIGAGGFGEVWRAQAPGEIFKAIKIIHGDLSNPDNDLVRYAEQELKSLKRVKQVRHPYLLALDRFDIVEGRLMIVMELADCNLWDRFRECRAKGLIGIPRDELLLYLAETAEVLDLFNDQFQLQHLDIKPQNLFLLANHVKVADFGQVKDLEGLVGAVTGGITPVYAAPETFDGIITRTCDQYSLACVYQELLTGTRPFDGCSMSALLMQHVNMPPNLDHSPACDRPALARALAKKPEDRWPSVNAFVRGLLSGSASGRIMVPAARAAAEGTGGTMFPPLSPPPAPVPGLPPTPLAPRAATGDTPDPPHITETGGPVFTPAPSEVTGPGPLRPALVIGVGQTGLRVLQRFRYDLIERYGQAQMLPIVQSLFVDTDPEDLDAATRTDPALRFAALEPADVFPAKLQRSAHYLKPRLSGRSLTEGWLDGQMLYKIPRTLQTAGIRMFGRLAFLDHYRPLMGKIHAAIDIAVAADSMTQTEGWTGLQRRTNRPLVYLVAGLGGGTGGGMFLDIAYAVQNRLRRMGYDAPEVIGVLVAPPADPAVSKPQVLGNTFAALTELNHYSRPDTIFTANHDERLGHIQEKGPPFTRCFIIPGVANPGSSIGANGVPERTPQMVAASGSRIIAKPGSRVIAKPGSRVMPALAAQRDAPPASPRIALKPYSDAAELIRLNLFEPLGRAIDETRAASDTPKPAGTVIAVGINGFSWPRSEIVARTAGKVARNVLKRWATPNARRMREVIPTLAQTQWTQLGLDPATVQAQLQYAADKAAGGPLDAKVNEIVEPLMPRGWLARLPEPERLSLGLDRLTKIIGVPGSGNRRSTATVERAVVLAATELANGAGLDVHAAVPVLVDDPRFRLAGAEDMLRQFHATTERLVDSHLLTAEEQDKKARLAFDFLNRYAHYKKGMNKPTAAELTEALKLLPRAQIQAFTARAVAAVYHPIRKVLAEQLAAISSARQQLEAANQSSPAIESVLTPERPPGNRQLMPPGCNGIGQAVELFLGMLTDADLNEIDHRVQAWIEPKYGTVFQACLHSTTGPEDILKAVHEESRAHVDAKLGSTDFASMFLERHRTPQAAERALGETFHEAQPAWVGSGPWVADEVTVVGCPSGAEGNGLRELAQRAIPVAGLPFADSSDALTVYREWPGVPVAALPHAGAVGVTAFQEAADEHQCTPHARLDVQIWAEIDAP